MNNLHKLALVSLTACSLLFACQEKRTDAPVAAKIAPTGAESAVQKKPDFVTQPLITNIFTADPSAHVFNGKIYIYPSHDIDTGITEIEGGDRFDMKDVHVLSMDSVGSAVKDNGEAINIRDIPWASRQLWAPDAAEKNGKYFLYFPVKDKQDIFRIGVGVSTSPTGPFTAEPLPIEGSFSTDPAVFKDSDGSHYMYFGGIWGGQLQRWTSRAYNPVDTYPEKDQPSLSPKIAKLKDNMLSFKEPPRDVQILDKEGKPLTQGDSNRRFFEGAWMHKYNNTYYFSYSTGDTHNIVYAVGDNPYGPFTYQGVILEPVLGWTSQHSIVEFHGKWYLFYHDSSLSRGQTHLRSVKVTELNYNPDGSIKTLSAFKK